ncbi:MAG: bifunctional riboflavin kinase/FAD synthetase [Deltaproteobacteria bacterium]|nr:bifunctional riboflavin kinase/FAD synthetase [Deltaproteobacteria bacterium]MBW1871666.1 bifunctional riboflavin kinase/FAD synthetase [Deltaproteobacteria bacterium]
MKVFEHYSNVPQPADSSVIAIGSFDGLHRGHQLLFERVRKLAKEKNCLAGALTFRPHPAKVLAPKFSPPLLMTHERKIEALESLGLDFTLAQKFDAVFADLSTEDFVRRVLVESLGVKVVVVGDDFSFGRNRQGLAEDLVDLGSQHGFEVEVVRRLAVEGMIVSSTRIRSFLLQGKVRGAKLLLGRTYLVPGQVVTGQGRGRTLGFPTANLAIQTDILPARGVYVCHFWQAGQKEAWLAVTNIGICPTFGPSKLSVEVHILDEKVAELAGQLVVVGFLERLRSEHRFDSPEDLCRQIEKDATQARAAALQYKADSNIHALDGVRLIVSN